MAATSDAVEVLLPGRGFSSIAVEDGVLYGIDTDAGELHTLQVDGSEIDPEPCVLLDGLDRPTQVRVRDGRLYILEEGSAPPGGRHGGQLLLYDIASRALRVLCSTLDSPRGLWVNEAHEVFFMELATSAHAVSVQQPRSVQNISGSSTIDLNLSAMNPSATHPSLGMTMSTGAGMSAVTGAVPSMSEPSLGAGSATKNAWNGWHGCSWRVFVWRLHAPPPSVDTDTNADIDAAGFGGFSPKRASRPRARPSLLRCRRDRILVVDGTSRRGCTGRPDTIAVLPNGDLLLGTSRCRVSRGANSRGRGGRNIAAAMSRRGSTIDGTDDGGGVEVWVPSSSETARSSVPTAGPDSISAWKPSTELSMAGVLRQSQSFAQSREVAAMKSQCTVPQHNYAHSTGELLWAGLPPVCDMAVDGAGRLLLGGRGMAPAGVSAALAVAEPGSCEWTALVPGFACCVAMDAGKKCSTPNYDAFFCHCRGAGAVCVVRGGLSPTFFEQRRASDAQAESIPCSWSPSRSKQQGRACNYSSMPLSTTGGLGLGRSPREVGMDASLNIDFALAKDMCKLGLASGGSTGRARGDNFASQAQNVAADECLSPSSPALSPNKGPKSELDFSKGVNVKVIARVRPMLPHETAARLEAAVSTNGRDRVQVEGLRPGEQSRHWTFDRVFGPGSTQKDVFDVSIQPLVRRVLQGFNCTVLAYGQTGSGKTYTMEGEQDDPALAGIIPRSIYAIFELLQRADATEQTVTVSHLEIYNDELGDLQREKGLPTPRTVKAQRKWRTTTSLALYNKAKEKGIKMRLRTEKQRREEDGDIDYGSGDRGETALWRMRVAAAVARHASKLTIRYDEDRGVVVEGLQEVRVNSPAEIFKILERTIENRETHATLCNKQSSRSHSIFSIQIQSKEWTESDGYVTKCGRLNLVDLSGSENIERSGAVDARRVEARHIGQGLLAVGRVIKGIVEKWAHIPYRDSKLTRILEDSLGGGTMTTLILNVQPARNALDETLSTLNYASLAKQVKSIPKQNIKKSGGISLVDKEAEEAAELQARLEAEEEERKLSAPPIRPWLARIPIRRRSTPIAATATEQAANGTVTQSGALLMTSHGSVNVEHKVFHLPTTQWIAQTLTCPVDDKIDSRRSSTRQRMQVTVPSTSHFDAMATSTTSSQLSRSALIMLRKIFNSFDADGDGMLSTDQILSLSIDVLGLDKDAAEEQAQGKGGVMSFRGFAELFAAIVNADPLRARCIIQQQGYSLCLNKEKKSMDAGGGFEGDADHQRLLESSSRQRRAATRAAGKTRLVRPRSAHARTRKGRNSGRDEVNMSSTTNADNEPQSPVPETSGIYKTLPAVWEWTEPTPRPLAERQKGNENANVAIHAKPKPKCASRRLVNRPRPSTAPHRRPGGAGTSALAARNLHGS